MRLDQVKAIRKIPCRPIGASALVWLAAVPGQEQHIYRRRLDRLQRHAKVYNRRSDHIRRPCVEGLA